MDLFSALLLFTDLQNPNAIATLGVSRVAVAWTAVMATILFVSMATR